MKTLNKSKKNIVYFNNKSQLERMKATFRLEGYELSKETITRCQMLIENKLTIEDAISLVKKDL